MLPLVLKNTVIILNFILAVVGLYLIRKHEMMTSVPLQLKFFDEFVEEISYMMNLLVPTGIMTISIATSVFLHSAYKKYFIHYRYICVLMLFILGEIMSGVYMYMSKQKIQTKAIQALQTWMREYENQTSSMAILNYLQAEFQCCGIWNSTDWGKMQQKPPFSCCNMTQEELLGKSLCPESDTFRIGCSVPIVNLMDRIHEKYLWAVTDIICIMIAMLLSTFVLRYLNVYENRICHK